jgi:photoactive yellow protein
MGRVRIFRPLHASTAAWYLQKMPKNIEQITSQDFAGKSPAEFDAMAFGMIQLDREGVVRTYNEWEAKLARRDAQDVIGRNFFTDVAPCTNVASFRGKLDELVASGEKTYIFDYEFTFPWGVRRVRVRFVVESDNERWVLVTNVG